MSKASQRRSPKLPPFLIFLLMLPALTGCASNPWPAEIEVTAPPPAVSPYRFLTWSKRDTPETIQQIRRHNATHARMTSATKGVATQ